MENHTMMIPKRLAGIFGSFVLLASGVLDGRACGPFFFQAPPPLKDYPERFAVKDWADLFLQENPIPIDAPTALELQDDALALAADWVNGTRSGKESAAAANAMMETNRNGHFRAGLANFLLELQDLTGQPLTDEVREYVAWRTQDLRDRGEGGVHPENARPTLEPWMDPTEELLAKQAAWDEARAKQDQFFSGKIASASPAMRPFWQVQKGAWLFRAGTFDAAATEFAQAASEAPGSSRADVALLMRGRSLLESARRIDKISNSAKSASMDEQVLALREEARSLFVTLEEADGRFAADAMGWQGAVAHDRGYPVEALAAQLRRLDKSSTREVRRSVYRESDRLFDQILNQDSIAQEYSLSQVIVDLARHPLLAERLLYACLDREARRDLFDFPFQENWDSDRERIDFLNRRIVRPRTQAIPLLEALGAAMLQNAPGVPDLRSILVLAWVATQNGNHAQALALLDLAGEIELTRDDVLHLRATAAIRAGRPQESLVALEKLADLHPESPLAVDLPWRMSSAYQAAGKPADAIRVLWNSDQPKTSDPSSNEKYPPLRIGFETDQQIDTLLQFSPIDQLLSLASADDQNLAAIARKTLRGRLLAKENFQAAEQLLDPVNKESVDDRNEGSPEFSMTRDVWCERVEPLQKAIREAELARGSEKGERLLEVARLWMGNRGWLTMNSANTFYPARDEQQLTQTRQRINGAELGIGDDVLTRELDRRDEAWHALQNALEASVLSEDPEVRAAALGLANEALFRMAEHSIYQGQRALETGATSLSANLVERLKREHAGSSAAKNAVAWVFPVANDQTRWMPGDYTAWNAEQTILEVLQSLHGLPLNEEDSSAANQALRDLLSNPESASFTREDWFRELSAIRANLRQSAPNDLGTLNQVDDFLSLASAERVPTDRMIPYIRMRLGGGLPSASDPFWEPVADFILFRELVEEEEDLPPEKSLAGSAERWQDFLTRFPDSPKAEAAAFRRLRLIARQSRNRTRIGVERWPASPVPDGYKTVVVHRQVPADPERVLAEVAAYRDKYPAPRYAANIDLIEAGAQMDAENWGEALRLLTGILLRPDQRDLHMDAGILFSGIAARLLDPDGRGVILEGLKNQPKALPLLLALINGDTFLSRLKPMRAALEGLRTRDR